MAPGLPDQELLYIFKHSNLFHQPLAKQVVPTATRIQMLRDLGIRFEREFETRLVRSEVSRQKGC